MVYCGIISLAPYRTLRSEGVTHSYAITLIADVIWKLYILGAKFLWLITGLITGKYKIWKIFMERCYIGGIENQKRKRRYILKNITQ